MKKLIAIIMILLTLTAFSSCVKDESEGSVNFGDYTPEADSTKIYYDNLINADTSWHSKYALKYSYYEKLTGESIIIESKCVNYYQSVDLSTNITTYCTQQEGYVLAYLLDKETKNGTVTIITNVKLKDAYPGFAEKYTCNPDFPTRKNVTKIGQDFVANRLTTKYKQTQTNNGVVTKIAYVWIDDELGIASKCEQYNAQTEELEMRWELLEFTQNVTESDVMIDIDSYKIFG